MNTLGSNLQEIYAACLCEEDAVLVASVSGSDVYDASCGWGRIWCAVDALFSLGLRDSKLKGTLLKTEALFKETLEGIQKQTTLYKASLEKRMQGEEVEDLHLIRQYLTEWNHQTAPFIKLLKEDSGEKIKTLCSGILFPVPENWDEIQHIQALINLEGYLHEALPLQILAKLACGTKLTAKEEARLDKWLNALNEMLAEVPFDIFYTAIESITAYLGAKAEHAKLLTTLAEKSPKLFQRADEAHLRWRSQLQPGDTVDCNGTTYILGKQLHERAQDIDHNLIFTLTNNTERVLVISYNRALPAIIAYLEKKHHWGVPRASTVEIDSRGKCWLAEKLVKPLSGRKWFKSDHKSLKPVANMVQWWIKEELSPHEFTAKHLFFDRTGLLKYTKVLFPIVFDFLKVEAFLLELANGDLAAFQYLMEQSGMADHGARAYFRTMLTNALNGAQGDPGDLAACRKIADPKVVDQGPVLAAEVLKLRESAYCPLKEAFKDKDPKHLLKTLNEVIISTYQYTKSASMLWPTMRALVDLEVIKQAKRLYRT